MKSDIEIAQAATMWPIEKVAKQAGFVSDEVIPYGKNTAKIEINEQLHKNETVS